MTFDGRRSNRGEWIMVTSEAQAELLASRHQWRSEVNQAWRAYSAGRDVEELRREQAYNAVIDQARWHKIPLRRLEREAADNVRFEEDVLKSLFRKVFFGEKVEPGHTGLFEHCSREQTVAYLQEAITRVQADCDAGLIRE